MSGSIYEQLLSVTEKRKAGFLYLIDPDKTCLDKIPQIVHNVQSGGCDAILIGGSLLFMNIISSTLTSSPSNLEVLNLSIN